MTDKQAQIIELFDNYLEPTQGTKLLDQKNSCKRSNVTLKCVHCKNNDCEIEDQYITPFMTPCFGDIGSKLMVIGEAPSVPNKSEGVKFTIGGLFREIKPNKSSPLYLVKDFFSENYGCVPYFTDLFKCGFFKQDKKKEKTGKAIMNKRINNCFKTFLKNEIILIEPEQIFCLSKPVYDKLRQLVSKDSDLHQYQKIIMKLIHYSTQANLLLSKEEKKIIWAIQTGKGKTDFKLADLSYFKQKE
jgi:hypothetical protein